MALKANSSIDQARADAELDPELAGIDVADPLCAVFRRSLKAEGLKYTPERARVLDAIIRHDGEGGLFQAETIIDDLRATGHRVSKATVYRTIKLLQDAGIVQRVLFDGEQAHFQLAYGATPSNLLVDVDTGELTPIAVPELDALRERLAREHGVVAQSHRFQVFVRMP